MNFFGRRPSTQDSSHKDPARHQARPSRSTHHVSHSTRRSVDKTSRRDSLDERSRQIVRLPRVSPQEAIDSLHGSLIDFSEYVTHLRDEFDRDVSLIKQYASPKDMESLWVSKVNESDRRGRDHSDAASNTGYRSRRTLLKRSLHLATMMTGTRKSEIDAVLAQKLHGMGKGIMELLHGAAHDHSSVGHLLTELEMLRVFLNRNGARTSIRQDRRIADPPNMERSGRGRGRDVEQRGRLKFRDDTIFQNPDPFGSPAHRSGPERTVSKPELADREGQDWDGQFDACSYRAACQSQGYRHHHDNYTSESPRGQSEYQGRWLPEPTRDSFCCDRPSPRKPGPENSPGNGKERDQRSIGSEPYPSREARQDTNHVHHSKGSHSCEDYHEEEERSDRTHEDRQYSHNCEGYAEDRGEARSEGADGGSGAEGEEPGRGHEPEYSGNFGGANDD